MPSNCGAGEDSWESFGQQGDPTSHPKGDQSWIFIGRTDAEAETPILWPAAAKNLLICKDPDARKDGRWKEKGMTEDEVVGWNHSTSHRWIWVWVNSGSWWWTGRPHMLQLMGLQRVGHNWVTELNWTEAKESWKKDNIVNTSISQCEEWIKSVYFIVFLLIGISYRFLWVGPMLKRLLLVHRLVGDLGRKKVKLSMV